MADVACPIVRQLLWPACWLDTPDRSSSSSTRVVQDVWDVYRDELEVVPEEVVLALRGAVSRSSVDDFWSIWSRNAEAGLFRAYSQAGPLKLAALPFLAEVCYGFVTGGLAMVMRLMYIALSTLFILLFLLYYSFVGVSNLLLMFLRVSGIRDLLRLGGMLSFDIGVLYVVMVRVVLFPHFIPGVIGFLRIFMAFTNGSLIP